MLSLAVFVVLGLLVRTSPSELDQLFREAVGTRWQGDLGTAALVTSMLLGPPLPVILGVTLIAATVVLRRRGDHARANVTLRVTVLLGACRITSLVAKPLFDRVRPREYTDFSYPSGHVASVASTGFAAVVLCLWLYPRLVALVRRVAIAATVLVSAARMVLAVHWLTDTVGSVLAVVGVGLLVGVALRLLPAHRGGVASAA